MLDQEEMVRKYRERIREKVEQELRDRRSQDRVEHNFSPNTLVVFKDYWANF